MKGIVLFLFAIICASSILFPQDSTSWKFTDQFYVRSEVDGRDFYNRTHPITSASLGIRLAAEKNFTDKVNVYTQLQYSRIMGSSSSSYYGDFNLHQGYIKLTNPVDLPVTVQAGRFEMSYGTERFFGKSDWDYVGKSYDGVRFSLDPGFKLDLFALTLYENEYIEKPAPQKYSWIIDYDEIFQESYSTTRSAAHSLYGFWESSYINPDNRLDIFGYADIDRGNNYYYNNAFNKVYTIGLNHFGNYKSISTIFEGAYQTGSRPTRSRAHSTAYLLSLQGNYNLNKWDIGLGADFVSGTNINSTNYGSFTAPYSTNHKFYGLMDYFPITDLAGNIGYTGVDDIYAKIYYTVNNKLRVSTDIHQFYANYSWDPYIRNYGEEVDVTVNYTFVKGTNIVWGGSVFLPGQLMKDTYHLPGLGVGTDPSFWSYVMIKSEL